MTFIIIMWLVIGAVFGYIEASKEHKNPVKTGKVELFIYTILGAITIIVFWERCKFIAYNTNLSWCNQTYSNIRKQKKKLNKKRKAFMARAEATCPRVSYTVQFSDGQYLSETYYAQPDFCRLSCGDPKRWKAITASESDTRKMITAKLNKEGVTLENGTYYPPTSILRIDFEKVAV